MKTITPHLWFDDQARQAAELYCSLLPDSRIVSVQTIRDTPSGDCDIVSFELAGQPFMAISAGPLFTFNPSVSLLVRCGGAEQVDELWRTLTDGGSELMPLDEYQFSERYAWVQDRYGLSWQLMLDDADKIGPRITPTLMFVGDVCGKAEEAIEFYTSIFPQSGVQELVRWQAGEAADQPGTIKHGTFVLAGQQFAAMDSAHDHGFSFNEAVSLLVSCEDQEEIDRYWSALSARPEAEQCGWLKDRYGLSWQIAPARLDQMLTEGSEQQVDRVTQAFLQMKKFDLAALERAYAGAAVPAR